MIGSLVSHVYDNKGTVKLPDIKADELQLAVVGDILIGILAAFAAIYLLHATLKAVPDSVSGRCPAGGAHRNAADTGFPRFNRAPAQGTLEQDVKAGEKKPDRPRLSPVGRV